MIQTLTLSSRNTGDYFYLQMVSNYIIEIGTFCMMIALDAYFIFLQIGNLVLNVKNFLM